MASSGHTLARAAEALLTAGPPRWDVAVTHALFAGDALETVRRAGVGEVGAPTASPSSNALPVAPMLAEALETIGVAEKPPGVEPPMFACRTTSSERQAAHGDAPAVAALATGLRRHDGLWRGALAVPANQQGRRPSPRPASTTRSSSQRSPSRMERLSAPAMPGRSWR